MLSNRRLHERGEDFILAMRIIPAATVVGDTTIGASGGPLVRELANGWTYQLSQWIEYTRGAQDLRGRRTGAEHRREDQSSDLSTTDAVLDRAIFARARR